MLAFFYYNKNVNAKNRRKRVFIQSDRIGKANDELNLLHKTQLYVAKKVNKLCMK